MGFGILIFGYFLMFAFSLSRTYFFADIIGTFITIIALSKLSAYNRYYRKALIAAFVFMLICGIAAISLMFELYSSESIAATVINFFKISSACFLHIFVFLGTRGVAYGADSQKLVKTAEHRLIATMLYYAVAILLFLLGSLTRLDLRYINTGILLYWLLCFILNIVFFYRCFAVLCPADEDENIPKKSRFRFINKINEKMDSFEKNSNKYYKQSIEMAQNELENKKESKKQKSKK